MKNTAVCFRWEPILRLQKNQYCHLVGVKILTCMLLPLDPCYLGALLKASRMFLMKVQEFSFPKLWRKPRCFIAEVTFACIAGKSEIFCRCIDPNMVLSKLLSKIDCQRKHKVVFLCYGLSG